MFAKFFILVFLFHATMGMKTYMNYTLFRTVPKSEEHLQFLQNLSDVIHVDFWRPPGLINKPVDILIGPEEKEKFMKRMDEKDYYYTTIIEDVQSAFDNQTVKTYIRRRMDSFDWRSYFRLSDIYNWIQDLAKSHPDEVKVITIGKTYENRDIIAVKVLLNGARVRSTVIVEGGIHAREWISTAFVTYFLNEVVTSSRSKDPEFRSIALKYEWYFVPCTNPDGYEYSHTQDRLWRKNRRNIYGVDINRNFDSAFGTVGVSYSKSSGTYCGEKAFSERESTALAYLIRSKQHTLEYYLAFHSYGQYMILPYAHSMEHLANYDEMARILRDARQAIREFYGTTYTIGTAYDTVGYMTSGVSGCWTKASFNVPYVATFELRDSGRHGFALPPQLILPTCVETLGGMKRVLTPRSQIYTKMQDNDAPDSQAELVLDKLVLMFFLLSSMFALLCPSLVAVNL